MLVLGISKPGASLVGFALVVGGAVALWFMPGGRWFVPGYSDWKRWRFKKAEDLARVNGHHYAVALGLCDPNDLLMPPMHSARLKVQLDWAKTAGGRNIHQARHTATCLWLANGVSVEKVQAWAGHASIVTTNRYVSYLGQDDEDEIAKVGRRTFGQVSGKCRIRRRAADASTALVLLGGATRT